MQDLTWTSCAGACLPKRDRGICERRAARPDLSLNTGNSGFHGVRRHPETSEPIPCPSLRAKRSNPGAAVRPSGLLAPRMLWPLDCFVARAPRNDGWVAADLIDSVVIGRRLSLGCFDVSSSPS